jgi:hypothetical protein
VKLSQGVTVPNQVAVGKARGGQLVGSTFTLGSIGSANPGNNWSAGQSPDYALDGSTSSKYLLFQNIGAGLIVAPEAGPTIINSLSFWTADDEPNRDPFNYKVYGSTTAATGYSGAHGVGSSPWTLIKDTTSVTLPAARNNGPTTVNFTNTTAYTSYLVVFPEAVVVGGGNNITQIGEVAFGYVTLTPPAGTDKTLAVVATSTTTLALADWGFTDPLDNPANNFAAVKITTLPATGTLQVDGVNATSGQTASVLQGPAGANWTPRETNRFWLSIASSADGSKLAAVVSGGQIYTSTDSGANWTARESSRNWLSIASSADGSKLAAVAPVGQIYTSTNSGANWTARDSIRNWLSIASSADGSKLAAGTSDGRIYTSTDSGTNWTARDSIRDWRSIASSADGSKLAAVANSGLIYTSVGPVPAITYTAPAGSGSASFTFQVQDDGASANLDLSPNTLTFNYAPPVTAPVVTSPTSASITATTATLGGNVTSSGFSSITQRGVIYSLTSANNNPVIGGPGVTQVSSITSDTDVLTWQVTGLTASSGYSFKAYATNGVGTSYTSVATFTTTAPPATAPVVTSPTSASITATTATLGGNATSDGGSAITERGVVYSLTSANNDPLISGSGVIKVTASGTTGVFTANVTGLTASSGYSFKIYATNGVGTAYTSVATFTTGLGSTIVTNANNSGPGSLRQAVLNANANPGADVITFDPTFFATARTIVLTGSNLAAFTGDTTVTGPAAGVTVEAAVNSGDLFTVGAGATVSFTGLTVTGSALSNAIVNNGTLTVSNCMFTSPPRGSDGDSNGIVNNHIATVTGCTFGSAGVLQFGLALFNVSGSLTVSDSLLLNCNQGVFNGGTATLSGCTINNEVGVEYGSMRNYSGALTLTNCSIMDWSGYDGLFIVDEGTLLFQNCTLIENAPTAGSTNAGTVTMKNTIYRRNPASAAITDGGGNLLLNRTGTDAPALAADLTALGLDPTGLQNNGGPTKTFKLLSGPAINGGVNANVPVGLTTDQRGSGFPRSVGTVDIGAYEHPAPVDLVATTTSAAEGSGAGTTTFTFTVSRPGATTSAVTLDYAVTGTGTNPADAADFGGTLPSGTVTLAIGEASKAISIGVSKDALVETDETFKLTLSNPTATHAIAGTGAVATIVNDDAGNNANLSALTLSSGTLSPVFASGTTSYTALVLRPTSTMTVTPTVAESYATLQVRINGGSYTSVTSGSPSGGLSLNLGNNTIDVLVTAQDGTTTKTYTTTVTRWSYLQGWRNQFFSTINNSGNAADNFTPQGDGLPNLLKFATGMDPQANGVSPTGIVYNGSTLEFTYPRSLEAKLECTFIVEWSETLLDGSWSTVGVSEQVLSTTSTLEQVKATIPSGSLGRRFVRLRVTNP